MSDSTTDRPLHQPSLRVAVVGGGLSGLAAAYEVLQQRPGATIQLYEASARLGGALHTLHQGDFLIEQGADSFITKTPDCLQLCRELGLEDRLMPTNEKHRRALIVHKGSLLPVPEGFVLMRVNKPEAIRETPLLSEEGKSRLLAEKDVPPHPNANDPEHDESVASFAIRRLGQEAYDRLVQPLMGGIYVADAHQLSLRATMPAFLEAERRHGSLEAERLYGSLAGSVQAAARFEQTQSQQTEQEESSASGARYSAFLTLPGGMSELITALQNALPADSIHFGQRVEAVKRGGDHWQVDFAGQDDFVGSEPSPQFDAVILATPAMVSSQVLLDVDADLSRPLSEIQAASSVVVSCAFPLEQIDRQLDGFGFVVPQIEKRKILAGSFSSVKFQGRAPDDTALIRVFLGGVLQSELVSLEDDAILQIVKKELAELLGVQGEPLTIDIARWHAAMPQYHVGHLQLVEQLEKQTAKHAGLALAGNSYRGVGIPHCVAQGRSAARAALNSLAS